jgi:subtilisin family serine protease
MNVTLASDYGGDGVEILGVDQSSTGHILKMLFDPSTNTYYNIQKEDFIKERYPISHSDRITSNTANPNPKVAILDTGMMLEHPVIKSRLKASVNFSDEPDCEDRNGHGTMTTLIILLGATSDIYNVKILPTKGKSRSINSLLKGIRWCVEKRMRIVNISAGIYQPSCSGNCELCTAVKEASDNNVIVVAAAGNRHGITSCPAKAGMHGVPIIAVGATDNLRVAPYSSEGNIYAPGDTKYKRVPIDDQSV